MKWFVIMFTIILRFEAVFSLKVKPLDHIERAYVKAGDTTRINCEGSARTDQLHWYRPTGELVGNKSRSGVHVKEHFIPATKHKIPIPSLELTVSHASVEDSGVWECRSGDLTQEYSLCVIDPTEFEDVPSEVSLDEGRSVSLTCNTKGNPEPRIVWYKDGSEINEDCDSKKYIIGVKYTSRTQEAFLTVKSADPEDVGVYTCEAHQEIPLLEDCSHTNSFNISLQVNYAPFFDDDKKTVYLFSKSNESISLDCTVNAFPQPTYLWYKVVSDTSFIKVSKLDGNQSNFTVTTGKYWDSAGYKYKCLASNEYGEVTRQFSMLKLERPKKPNLITIENITDSRVYFNISWDTWIFDSPEHVAFPVDGYEIEYKPSTLVARRGHRISHKLEHQTIINDMLTSMRASLNLQPETKYSVRINLQNEAGPSPWYGPIYVEPFPQDTDELISSVDETIKPSSKQLKLEDGAFLSSGVIVGLVLTVFIVGFGAACINVIKRF